MNQLKNCAAVDRFTSSPTVIAYQLCMMSRQYFSTFSPLNCSFLFIRRLKNSYSYSKYFVDDMNSCRFSFFLFLKNNDGVMRCKIRWCQHQYVLWKAFCRSISFHHVQSCLWTKLALNTGWMGWMWSSSAFI